MTLFSRLLCIAGIQARTVEPQKGIRTPIRGARDVGSRRASQQRARLERLKR
jgi:hypothetical protein